MTRTSGTAGTPGTAGPAGGAGRPAVTGHHDAALLDDVATVTSPTPMVDAAMLDAFGSSAPAPRPAQLFAPPPEGIRGFTMVGPEGGSCGPDGC